MAAGAFNGLPRELRDNMLCHIEHKKGAANEVGSPIRTLLPSRCRLPGKGDGEPDGSL
jgi:hypothetical protein